MKAEQFRDLTVIFINDEQLLLISCDSSGAVGNKENDIIKTSPDILAYYTTHVALAELIAVGAEPISIINTLSVEMDDTGLLVIEGIKGAIKPLALTEVIISGSTEENFPVSQTGIGITVIGIIEKKEWRKNHSRKDSLAAVVGLPKVGDEVLVDNNEILTISILQELKNDPKIYEILPVGSKGVLFEAKQMALSSELDLLIDKNIGIDISKSAGPATCAVISIDKQYFEIFKKNCPIPVNKIGMFI